MIGPVARAVKDTQFFARGLRANVECLGGKPARALLVSSPLLTIRNAADQLEIADTPPRPNPVL